MAKTFRSTRHIRSFQLFTTTVFHANPLFGEDEATHCSNAATPGETENRLDRCTSDPARVTQSKWRHLSPIALDDQAPVAPGWLDRPSQAGKTGIFSETLAGGVWQPACAGLDVPVSRRRSQDLCLSYIEFAHAHLRTNHCARQKLRNGSKTRPADLENPGNPAVFAARQRCGLLRRVQSTAHFRAVRTAVFVSGHRTDLLACGTAGAQRRGRRIEWLVGKCVLGTQTLQLFRARLSHQSNLRSLVFERVCTTVFDRHHASTSARSRNTSSSDGQTGLAFARSLADYRWSDPYHSPSPARWHDHRPQRILERQQAFGRQICLGYDHYPLPTLGNLVSTFCSTSLAFTQKPCL